MVITEYRQNLNSTHLFLSFIRPVDFAKDLFMDHYKLFGRKGITPLYWYIFSDLCACFYFQFCFLIYVFYEFVYLLYIPHLASAFSITQILTELKAFSEPINAMKFWVLYSLDFSITFFRVCRWQQLLYRDWNPTCSIGLFSIYFVIESVWLWLINTL